MYNIHIMQNSFTQQLNESRATGYTRAYTVNIRACTRMYSRSLTGNIIGVKALFTMFFLQNHLFNCTIHYSPGSLFQALPPKGDFLATKPHLPARVHRMRVRRTVSDWRVRIRLFSNRLKVTRNCRGADGVWRSRRNNPDALVVPSFWISRWIHFPWDWRRHVAVE